jgi:N-acetylglucosaminyldiphosphoundecaprenol N-acetyl-beta-D-mannosaminyltransferase
MTRVRERVTIGGVPIDPVTMSEAVDAIDDLVQARRGGSVFTPNVDHVVECQDNGAFREAYAAVDLSLADGMPVVWSTRLLGRPVPEKVSGSDLVEPLARRAGERGWRVFLLGGGEGIAQRAGERMVATCPGMQIAGVLGPRIDMSRPREERSELLETIRAARPDLVLVALGAPKQELWIHESREALAPAVLLGIGASLDFIAGAVQRAPRWVSRTGLEWAYRLAREPRRLWRRYLVRDPRFLAVLLSELARPRRRGGAAPPP